MIRDVDVPVPKHNTHSHSGVSLWGGGPHRFGLDGDGDGWVKKK